MNTPVMIEDVADYWNRRPCNLRHSASDIGTRMYFDEVERRKYLVEPHIPGFAAFDRWCGKRVLEIGCGLGTDAVNFARAGADYYGVDLSDASLSLARRRFEIYGLTGAFAQGNAEELGAVVEPATVDLVYSFGVIHHTPHPERIVAQARRALCAGGEFRLMLYARNSWKDVMIETGLDQPEAQSGCPIALTYTHADVRGLLEPAGFTIESITQDHIFPYVIEKYRVYEYEMEPWFAAMPPAMFRALERRFGWHLLIVARPT